MIESLGFPTSKNKTDREMDKSIKIPVSCSPWFKPWATQLKPF